MRALKEPLRWYHFHAVVMRNGLPSREQGDCLAPDRQSVKDIVLPSLYGHLDWSPISVYYVGEKADYDAMGFDSVEPRIDQLELPW